MLESLLVALIVAAAAVYALWQLTPAPLRLRFAQAFARRCAQTRLQPLAPALTRAATPSQRRRRTQPCPVGRTRP
ncbi:MAG: hypothetical protein IPO66_11485 [Rhodanobacteraceae bacterium]|nr:hypothetical protein [Rhodanobacteraceae bacterium]